MLRVGIPGDAFDVQAAFLRFDARQILQLRRILNEEFAQAADGFGLRHGLRSGIKGEAHETADLAGFLLGLRADDIEVRAVGGDAFGVFDGDAERDDFDVA